MSKTIKNAIFATFNAMLGSDEIRAGVDALSAQAQALTLLAVRHSVKALQARDKVITKDLLDTIETKGKAWTNAKGEATDHTAINLGELNAIRQKKVGEADQGGVKTLLASKGIDASACFDKVQIPASEVEQFNADKLAALIKAGKVTQDEIDNLRPVDYSLVLEPTAALKAEVAGLGKDDAAKELAASLKAKVG